MQDINLLKNNGIDVDSGIDILGDLDTYNEILADFLEASGERMLKLEEYKNAMDMKNYAIEVHALKGDSKYLGFTKLADISLAHQLKSEENNIDYVNNHYNELVNEANRIINVVNDYLN